MYTKLLFSVGIISVILNAAMIPSFGIIGAAMATSMAYAFGFFIAIFYVKKFVVIKFPVSGMLKAFFGGVIVLGLVLFLKAAMNFNPVMEIIVSGIVSAIAYLLFTIRFLIGKDDLRILSAIGIKLPKFVNNWLMKTLK